jgi:polyhydroxybutyrate depolymerase
MAVPIAAAREVHAYHRVMRFALLLVLGACSGSDATTDAGADGVAIDGQAVGTAGCGKPSTIAAETWVSRDVTVGAVTRPYFIRIPAGYDPARPYQIVYQQHGCSTAPNRETNNVPLEGQSGANAILVRGRAAADCWDTNASGVDVAYWDAMVADVEATWCVDAARRFATGYSSGSFMTHRLACLRGDMLRGVATIAGGQAEGACKGPLGALLIHDLNDNTVNISASIAARDSHRTRNSCGTTTTPTAMAPCVAYDGCGKPVVWCQTTGKDHARQDQLAAPIFWDFLSRL